MTMTAAERAVIDRLGTELPEAVRVWLDAAAAGDRRLPINLGVALYKAGADDLAARQLRRALALDPTSVRVAGMLVAMERPEPGRPSPASLIIEGAGSPAAFAQLGRDLIHRGFLARGIAALDRALADAPREMDWIGSAAMAEWHLYLGEEAIARLSATGHEPHTAVAYWMAYTTARELPCAAPAVARARLWRLCDRLMQATGRDPEVLASQIDVLMDPATEGRYPGFLAALPARLSDPALASLAADVVRFHGRSPPWETRAVAAEAEETAVPPPHRKRLRPLARPAGAADARARPGDDGDAIRRMVSAHRLREVAVLSGEWLVVLPGDEIVSEMWFHVPGQNRSSYIDRMWMGGLSIHLRGPRLRIEEPVVLIGGADNYYHWMIDFLPRLLCALETPSLAGRKLVVATGRTSFEQETIALFDTPQARLLEVPYPAVVDCADLVALDFGPRPMSALGTPAMFRCATPPPVLSALRSRLLSAFRTTPRKRLAGGRRLFVVRRDARRQHLINEEAVADRLAGLGFEAVALSGLDVAAQVALFAEAEIIVGAHGAGLTNALFAPRGAGLLELHGVTTRPDFFEKIAAAVGLRHAAVLAERTLIGDEKRFSHRFAVDPDRTHDAVVGLLDDLRRDRDGVRPG